MIGKNGSNNNDKENNTTIICVNSSCVLYDIQKITKEYPDSEIISFDYESHELLQSSNIVHEISDDQLTKDDIKKIQNLYYDVYKWYEKPEVKNSLEYSGVNIGQLFSEEIVHLLVKNIKNFVEIKRICEKNKITLICPNSLYDTAQIFAQNVVRFASTKQEEGFVYDAVRYNFKIGNKYFIIKVPRSFYLKIKQMSELFIHALFGPKTNDDNNKILLVELNTLRYKSIFSALEKANVHAFFFGRRRPAVWNKESYSIIKKSNCKIITNLVLLNAETNKSIKNGVQTMVPKLNSVWGIEFFKNYFSFENVSFWKVIEPYFRQLIEDRITETISEIEITKKLLNKYKFSSILVLSEVGFTEQVTVKLAKSLGIPVFLHQLGLHWDTPEASDMNKSQGVYPIDSSKFLVWGNVAARDAIRHGISKEKIEITGAPRWDYVKKSESEKKSEYILLATSGPQREDINGLLVQNNEQYIECIKKISQITTKLGKKLIIKLHPSPHEIDVTDMVHKINENIVVVTTGDILSLIDSCEIMIMLGLSTAIIEAQMNKKPVLSISPIDYNLGHASVLDACVLANMNDFEEKLFRLLNDSKFKQEIITKGTEYVNDCFSNQGNAAIKLVECMKNV